MIAVFRLFVVSFVCHTFFLSQLFLVFFPTYFLLFLVFFSILQLFFVFFSHLFYVVFGVFVSLSIVFCLITNLFCCFYIQSIGRIATSYVVQLLLFLSACILLLIHTCTLAYTLRVPTYTLKECKEEGEKESKCQARN